MLPGKLALRHPAGAARGTRALVTNTDAMTKTNDVTRRPPRPMRLHPRYLLPLALIAGCDGCRNEHPYTPYTLGSSDPSNAASAPQASASPTAAPTGRAETKPHPGADAGILDGGADGGGLLVGTGPLLVGTPPPDGGGKRWTIEGDRVAEAPAGRSFETGLVFDADGDGARDLVAWTRAPDGLRGELLFVPGASSAGTLGAPRTLAALPAALAPAGCSSRAALSQISPVSLALAVVPRCPDEQLDRASRWVALLRTALPGSLATPALILELRVRGIIGDISSASAPGAGAGSSPRTRESLDVVLDASDRDGDGREDLALRFTFTPAVEAAVPPPAPEPREPRSAPAPAHDPHAHGDHDGHDHGPAAGSPPHAPEAAEANAAPSASARANSPARAPRPVTAPLWFLDRPAGLSRDASQPGAALRALAEGLLQTAGNKSKAPDVPARANAIRRLRTLLCEDAGGTAAVTLSDGPIRCADADIEKTLRRAEALADMVKP
ncbi:hypothetical protein [Chondromyces crocatus]|uniref:Uncharacterized protein n=1 Tax=Chondromyces crocatus TaxID=52 RepID=A0A0K1ETD3_CHOCO|nr:hypothetical protein [Chondromyces crocatus]AKT44180.1 uncharacterized protein CMC5_084200 [Chondromyces crocatus]